MLFNLIIHFILFSVLYNGTFSQKILDKVDDPKLFSQLANYEPDVYVAKKISFYKHTVYYPPHIPLIESVITAIENLRISIDNASTVGTQINVAKALIHSVSDPSHLKQYGPLNTTIFI